MLTLIVVLFGIAVIVLSILVAGEGHAAQHPDDFSYPEEFTGDDPDEPNFT